MLRQGFLATRNVKSYNVAVLWIHILILFRDRWTREKVPVLFNPVQSLWFFFLPSVQIKSWIEFGIISDHCHICSHGTVLTSAMAWPLSVILTSYYTACSQILTIVIVRIRVNVICDWQSITATLQGELYWRHRNDHTPIRWIGKGQGHGAILVIGVLVWIIGTQDPAAQISIAGSHVT